MTNLLNNNIVTYNNPIMPGFYPDPSVCRVGEDYYLVTSTFAYFPGVPIFHSRDLVNWKQIGNVLDRPSQLNLQGAGHSQGIFAPTLRYHEGIFYMITTNVTHGGNFVVTATDPSGPWSDPYFIQGAEGIDPTIFFDDDGKAYYLGTRPNSEGLRYDGNWEVWLKELNIETMELVGDSHVLWKGAMVDVIWPEGPHLYKKDDYYYLMIAEGGTGPNHAVTIARSKNLTGGYEGNQNNPIITHRHLGKHYPIVNVGHADLIQSVDGQWFMVLLASRPYGGYSNLGRETFLASVIWENGWPVVNEGRGILAEQEVMRLTPVPVEPQLRCDHFDSDKLALKWMFLRNPQEDLYSLTERKGYLRLRLKSENFKAEGNPSFICLRQQHFSYVAATAMEFTPRSINESAGLVVIQNDMYHIRFEYAIVNERQVLRVVTCIDGEEANVAQVDVEAERLYLKIAAMEQQLSFYYSTDADQYHLVTGNVNTSSLSTEVAGGFVGCCIGMYCTSNGTNSENVADFDWFEYGSLYS